jgi:hypothetical protein
MQELRGHLATPHLPTPHPGAHQALVVEGVEVADLFMPSDVCRHVVIRPDQPEAMGDLARQHALAWNDQHVRHLSANIDVQIIKGVVTSMRDALQLVLDELRISGAWLDWGEYRPWAGPHEEIIITLLDGRRFSAHYVEPGEVDLFGKHHWYINGNTCAVNGTGLVCVRPPIDSSNSDNPRQFSWLGHNQGAVSGNRILIELCIPELYGQEGMDNLRDLLRALLAGDVYF